jgi:hypothetical protein
VRFSQGGEEYDVGQSTIDCRYQPTKWGEVNRGGSPRGDAARLMMKI